MRTLCVVLSLLVLSVPPASIAKETRGHRTAAVRGWLGFGFELHRETGEKHPAWLHVRRVSPDGPAFKAGLQPQDVIVAINDAPIAFPTDTAALNFFASRRPGEKVALTVARTAGRVRVTVVAARPPARAAAAWKRNYEGAATQDAENGRKKSD